MEFPLSPEQHQTSKKDDEQCGTRTHAELPTSKLEARLEQELLLIIVLIA